ncbi:glycosyl transferase [Fragilaria crotonensis]|nr:glycosyl transferase [Fragilaria crotonensis]
MTANDIYGSWDLMSKVFTPRIESSLEQYYEVDYSILEFGLELKKIHFPAEISRSLRPNNLAFNKVHIIIIETDEAVVHQENSTLEYFLMTSEKASKQAPIETTTFGAGVHFTGWGDKYVHIRDMLQTMSDDALIVVSDSRDVLLNIPDNVEAANVVSHFVSTFKTMTENVGDAVVMSAESQCCVSAMSHASPLDYFDPISGERIGRACNSGESSCPYEGGFDINAWKTFMSELAYKKTGRYHESSFLNAGIFAGTARNIIRLLDRVKIGPTEDDQAVMSGFLYHDPEALVLDYENELFGVAERPKGLEQGCIFFKDIDNVLIHSVTKTSPLIIHTPGKFYSCLDLLIDEVGGLSQRRYLKSKKEDA